MKFTKMQGCGNDYIYVDCFSETVPEPSALARKISDRHYGVGGDGLILIEPSEKADAFMHMFNADGSEGAMCGNGVRCVAKYLYDHGIVPEDRRAVSVDTRAGVKRISFRVKSGKAAELTVDMGRPMLTSRLPEPITIQGMPLRFLGVDVGNPHAVFFLEDNAALGAESVSELDLKQLGRAFETHPRFPDRVNSEFIEIASPHEINFRVWERGSGETLACGTGTVAAVYAGICMKKLDNEVSVHLPGGDLSVRFDPTSGRLFLTGNAEEVFAGEYDAASSLSRHHRRHSFYQSR